MSFCGPCRSRLHIYGQRPWVSDHPHYKPTVGLKVLSFLSHSFLILEHSDNNSNYLTGCYGNEMMLHFQSAFVKNDVLVLTWDPSIPWVFRQTVWTSTVCQALGLQGGLMPGAYSQEPVRQHDRSDMWKNHPNTVALEFIPYNLLLKNTGPPVLFIITRMFFSSCRVDCGLPEGRAMAFTSTATYIVLSE